MADTLLLRLSDVGDDAQWCLFSSGVPLGPAEQGTLAEVASRCAGNKVVVIVPGQHVLLTRVSWPSRQRQRLRQAVPYLLEEHLIGDVEQQHFALGLWEGDELPVAVVARARMERWQAQLQESGIAVAALVPDVLMLPREPGEWTLYLDDQVCMVRTGAQSGFSADPVNAEALIGLALSEAGEKPVGLRVVGESPAWLHGLAESFGLALVTAAVSYLEGSVGDFDERQGLNLLQGDFSRKEQLGRLLRPWLPAAALIGGWILLNTVSTGLEYWKLTDQRQQVQQQINQVYLDTFPDARRVVNARVQMEQHLRELRDQQRAAGGPELTLIAALADAVDADASYSVQQVRLEQQQLELSIELPSLTALEQFKQRLTAAPGLKLDVQSVTPRQDKVEIQALLRGGGV